MLLQVVSQSSRSVRRLLVRSSQDLAVGSNMVDGFTLDQYSAWWYRLYTIGILLARRQQPEEERELAKGCGNCYDVGTRWSKMMGQAERQVSTAETAGRTLEIAGYLAIRSSGKEDLRQRMQIQYVQMRQRTLTGSGLKIAPRGD